MGDEQVSAIIDMDRKRELLKKRQELEEAKINREYTKLEEAKALQQELEGLSLDAIEAEKGQDYAKMLINELELSAKLIKNSVPFISDKLGRLVPQIPGQVTMLGAISGTGKCFRKGTPILMFDGTIKNVEDVTVGDLVMGPDSKPRYVDSLAYGEEEMFEIKPTKGDSYFVNRSHILSLKYTQINNIWKDVKKGDIVNISVEEYLDRRKTAPKSMDLLKGYRCGVDFEEKELPINPYYLGIWLGDGTSESQAFSNIDTEIIEAIKKIVHSEYPELNFIDNSVSRPGRISFNIAVDKHSGKPNRLRDQMRSLNLFSNKHIPHIYLTSSRQQRLELLAGLVDSDGSNSCNCIDFIFKSKTLAENVVFLCRSLGFAAYIKKAMKRATNSKNKVFKEYYRISVSGDLHDIPIKVPRKQFNKRTQIKNVLHHGIKVSSVGHGQYFGFSVTGPDHRFLLGDFTVVHNSSNVAAIAHRNFTLGKRTLVISNEESKQSATARIACIEAKVSFNDYMQDLVPKEDRKLVAQKILEVEPFVTVVDHPLASTTAERVVDLIHQADKKNYSIAVVDFVQRITRSSKNPTAETVQVLYMFKDLLTDYSSVGKMPVILMSQLKPMAADELERNIQDRIGWCKGIYEACANVIEAIKLDNVPVTTYHVQKGRFSGSKKLWVPHEFDNGLFKPIDKTRLSELRGKYRLEKAEEDLGEILVSKPKDNNDDS